ncbi:probable glutamate--tRNA ligase, mitochondrial [Macrosteles quadrilineatus]|uniref:probable glutamate--tRNA ligase, mitochondrial n=1 Tax=Macrosteles quadrilineatus TaxID=74068 RepID=UPI0023E2492B|nr:probable glutamate--tRNA ligase, mitochondrial [Macrosteles quadrilineatus]
MLGSQQIYQTLFKRSLIFTFMGLPTCVRLAHTENEVRVRFAPSPTGFLHLGGLRTALYNFLFAKSKGGTFILRIEDTDQTRLVEGAMEQLQEDLEWAGIIPDESPLKGGKFGPYQQSKRLDLYKTAVEQLIQNGAAYHCFCTEHRLELLRKDALRRRQTPRYDNRCRHLSKEEVEDKLKSGGQQCVRLKLVPGCETYHDLVYGNITHDVVACEGDPVIFKSDGFPTYHLANVVDDHYMRITHVLRGVEWQSSTPKHLMLYKGLGWEPPEFAHLPLLMNADGTKLSKRQGDITVKHYRSDDVLPQALVNFVTFSGGGFHRDNSDQVRSLSTDQLAAEFDLGLVGVASCRVSLERLDDFNKAELARQMANETEMAVLVKQFRSKVAETYKDQLELDLNEDYVRSVMQWSLQRITRLGQLAGPNFSYLWVRPPVTNISEQQAEWVSAVYEHLQATDDFTQKPLSDSLRVVAKQSKVKVMEVMHLMRMILCGRKEGPAVGEMLEMLGRETSLNRIQATLNSHQQSNTEKTSSQSGG